VLHNLVFNFTNLFLNHLLVAEHVIQLGWDGVAEVENASASTANCQEQRCQPKLLDERRAKTLVVAQGLTRRVIRCPYFNKDQPLP
jgi:hypothetical protein